LFTRSVLLTTILAVGLAWPAQAQVDIDFEDQVLGTPVNGLTVQNVMFQYFVGGVLSSDATVTSYPLGCTEFLCGTVIEGGTDDASLVMNFGAPLRSVSFGLAAGTTVPTTANVSLFNPGGALLEMRVLNLTPGATIFSEGLFDGGMMTLGSLRIDLDPAMDAGRFALDNVTGRTVAVGVPEPTTWLLMATGLFAMGVLIWRRRDQIVLSA